MIAPRRRLHKLRLRHYSPAPSRMTNCRNPANLEPMVREISAGGVVVRRVSDTWQVAVIEPNRENVSSRPKKSKSHSRILALPKGLVDPGERPEETAVREVREETGITASILTKLRDIKYMYVRSWGDKERVFKIVSFYLLRYEGGRIDDISVEMRVEVERALWISLNEAGERLTYKSEREIGLQAKQYLETIPLSETTAHRHPGTADVTAECDACTCAIAGRVITENVVGRSSKTIFLDIPGAGASINST
jgi:8-oxo-dGTP pyrophosphatase MutT (NUDIX family)